MKLTYRPVRMGTYYQVHCEWGTVPALYSSEDSARLASDIFNHSPKFYWPITFRHELGVHESTALEHMLYHDEIMLFLPSHCFYPWSWQIDFTFKVNLFTTVTEAYSFAAKMGEVNVRRIAKRYRPYVPAK